MLTKENCPLCDRAKELLGRLESGYRIDVRIVWLETPEGQELAELHQTPFPPALIIDGELHGFGRPSENKLRRDFQRMGVARRSIWERFRRSQSSGGR